MSFKSNYKVHDKQFYIDYKKYEDSLDAGQDESWQSDLMGKAYPTVYTNLEYQQGWMDAFNTAAEQCYTVTKIKDGTVIVNNEKFYDRFNTILKGKIDSFNSHF